MLEVKKVNNMRIILVLITIGVFTTSCATHRTYQGNPKPTEEVVNISGMWGWNPINNFHGTMVCMVDSIPFESCKTDVEILPGKHTLVLRSTDFFFESGRTEVTRDFKAGEKYVIGIRFESVVSKPPILVKR